MRNLADAAVLEITPDIFEEKFTLSHVKHNSTGRAVVCKLRGCYSELRTEFCILMWAYGSLLAIITKYGFSIRK